MVDKPITPIQQLLMDSAANRAVLNKLFAAQCGTIVAVVGQKFIATPWYVDVTVIMSLISGTFLAVTLKTWWKSYSVPQKVVRIAGSALLLISSVTQIWIYRPGEELPPSWFPCVINILLTALAVALMWAGWTQKPKKWQG